jgi:hypothetical protein
MPVALIIVTEGVFSPEIPAQVDLRLKAGIRTRGRPAAVDQGHRPQGKPP